MTSLSNQDAAAATLPTLYFESQQFVSHLPGPAIIITGAVHGNETCGTQAIRRFVREVQEGKLRLLCGKVSLVPVCNPLAYARGAREGERNLNRKLIPTDNPSQYEDYVANWLCPLLAQHQVLLDLHSFRSQGEAFVLIGPENNQGALEPFALAEPEWEMARRLGVKRVVQGWLSTYADGVTRRQQWFAEQAASHPGGLPYQADPEFGVGTTEYMRRMGGYAMTLECGQHDDIHAPELAYQAILSSLRWLGIVDGEPLPAQEMEILRMVEVIDKWHADDRFVRDWISFDEVSAGEILALRADGTEIRAQRDGRVIFPDANAAIGEEWLYLSYYQPAPEFTLQPDAE